MQVTITLDAGAGADLDGFNLTANTGTVTPSTATRAQLLSGLTVTVDNAATSVTVTATGNCTNNTTANISGIPAGSCTFHDVTVSQADLDLAVGNTETGKNDGTLYYDYIACDGTASTMQFGGDGTYVNAVCVEQFSSTDLYYYANNDKVAPATSFAGDNGTPCT